MLKTKRLSRLGYARYTDKREDKECRVVVKVYSLRLDCLSTVMPGQHDSTYMAMLRKQEGH
jgi:hypothetical protein